MTPFFQVRTWKRRDAGRSLGRDLVAFSGHGVTCTATETVKGNRGASSGRQCASREIKLIGKNQFLPGSTAAVLQAMPSESILYSSRRALGATLQSGLTSLSTIARPRSSTFTRLKCVPPAHRANLTRSLPFRTSL